VFALQGMERERAMAGQLLQAKEELMQSQAAAAQAKEELSRLKVQVAELRANIRIKDAALEAKDAAVQSKDAVMDAKDYLIRRVQSESQLQPEFAAPPAASALQSAPLPPPAQSTTHGNKTYAGGAVYEGESKDDTRNGRGKHTWPCGKIYEGE
jgi:hypothetical protein